MEEPQILNGNFSYHIGPYKINYSFHPIVMNRNRYICLKLRDSYLIVLINVKISNQDIIVCDFLIPFYRSSGMNSGLVARNTWIPFNCTALKHGSNDKAFNIDPNKFLLAGGAQVSPYYFYKINHFYSDQPFSSIVGADRYLQTKLIQAIRQTINTHYTSAQQGIQTFIDKMGNLFNLSISVFMFGLSGIFDIDLSTVDDTERSLIESIRKITLHGIFGGMTWGDIIKHNSQYYTPIPSTGIRDVQSHEINCIFALNGVTMPYYKIDENVRDAFNSKLIMEQSICVFLGELFINSKDDDNPMKFFRNYIDRWNTMKTSIPIPSLIMPPEMIIAPDNKYKIKWYLADICGIMQTLYFPIYQRI